MADVTKIKLPDNSEYNLKDHRIPGVDTTPTSGSDNVVTSGGVYNKINEVIGTYGNAKIFYGTCSTSGSNNAKQVTCSEFTSADLVSGVLIYVKFDNTNTASRTSLSMKVGNTSYSLIKQILNGSVSSLTSNDNIVANTTYLFQYDGTYWLYMNIDQVRSDWNATSGMGVILNKPSIPSLTGYATEQYVDEEIQASQVTESTVSNWGFTKNTGTITGVTFNGVDASVTNGVASITATISPDNVFIIPVTKNGTSYTTTVTKAEAREALRANKLLFVLVLYNNMVMPLRDYDSDDYGEYYFYAISNSYIYTMDLAAGPNEGVPLSCYYAESAIPTAVTESTVSGWGFTKNTGTLTGVNFNGTDASVSNGVASITATIPLAPGTLNTTATTEQSTNSSEALSGNITLHKVAKTGKYSDLVGTPNNTVVYDGYEIDGNGVLAGIIDMTGTHYGLGTMAETMTTPDAMIMTTDLYNIPTVPTNVSSFTNDVNYVKYVLCANEAAYSAISNKDSGTLYLIPKT